MPTRVAQRLGAGCLAFAGLGTAALIGACAGSGADAEPELSATERAEQMMAAMDALPPEEQLPNWSVTRALMARRAPAVGEPAPDFSLQTFDGSEVLTLSEFQPTRPVVLVFGSWT